MAGNLQPLDDKFAIVGSDGRPTLYFIQWAQQKQIDIQGAITEEQFNELLVQYLLDHQLQEGSGIQITPDGNLSNSPTIAADAQEILDQITATRGAILYRGLLGWSALLPGTASYLLQTNGAGADPTWVAPPAAGAAQEIAVTKPVAANFTLLNGGAGTTMTDKTFGLLLDAPVGAGAGLHIAQANAAPGAAAFTLTAKLRPMWPFTGVNYQAALILRNSTSGRIIVFGDDTSEDKIFVNQWSSFTVFNANIFAPVATETPWWPWRRITLAAGTLSFQVSPDGDAWYTIATVLAATYINAAGGVINQVGFGTYGQGGTLCNSWTVV